MAEYDISLTSGNCKVTSNQLTCELILTKIIDYSTRTNPRVSKSDFFGTNTTKTTENTRDILTGRHRKKKGRDDF